MAFQIAFDDHSAVNRSGKLIVGSHSVSLPNVILAPRSLGLLTVAEIMRAGLVAEVNTFALWQLQQQGVISALPELGNHGGLLMTTDPFAVGVSYAKPRGVKGDIVRFRVPGQKQLQSLTPKQAVAMQTRMGADLISLPEQVPDYFAPKDILDVAGERTANWSGQAAGQLDGQLPVVGWQGGGLRRSRQTALAKLLAVLPPSALAIGGVFQTEPVTESQRLLSELVPMLANAAPDALRLVNSPANFQQFSLAWRAGLDLVTTACPTDLAQAGQVLTYQGPQPVADLAGSQGPLDVGCHCPVCQHYSAQEIAVMVALKQKIGYRLLAVHNLATLSRIVHNPAVFRD